MNIFLKFIVAVLAIAVLAGAGYFVWQSLNVPKPVACTTEAKICPDGSYVSRTAPNCEFAPCPIIGEANLKTFSDSTSGISFQYPEKLQTQFISTVDWPPMAAVLNSPFACTQAGLENAPAGITAKEVINGRNYCVTKETQGAAGSIYTQYAYAFSGDLTGLPQGVGETVILTFSLRFSQCGNYSDPQMTACENERTSFNPGLIIDQIARSLRVAPASNPPLDIQSGIQGSVLLGPTCPVVRNPPNPQCGDKPYQTKLDLVAADQSQVITEFSSDANGKFIVRALPGVYAIRNAAGANILPRCASNGTVTVAANQFTAANVSCDTGIR